MKYYIINIKITEEKRLIMTVESFSYLPEDALKIRIKVFVDEQGFIDEVDEIDSTASLKLCWVKRSRCEFSEQPSSKSIRNLDVVLDIFSSLISLQNH